MNVMRLFVVIYYIVSWDANHQPLIADITLSDSWTMAEVISYPEYLDVHIMRFIIWRNLWNFNVGSHQTRFNKTNCVFLSLTHGNLRQ